MAMPKMINYDVDADMVLELFAENLPEASEWFAYFESLCDEGYKFSFQKHPDNGWNLSTTGKGHPFNDGLCLSMWASSLERAFWKFWYVEQIAKQPDESWTAMIEREKREEAKARKQQWLDREAMLPKLTTRVVK